MRSRTSSASSNRRGHARNRRLTEQHGVFAGDIVAEKSASGRSIAGLQRPTAAGGRSSVGRHRATQAPWLADVAATGDCRNLRGCRQEPSCAAHQAVAPNSRERTAKKSRHSMHAGAASLLLRNRKKAGGVHTPSQSSDQRLGPISSSCYPIPCSSPRSRCTAMPELCSRLLVSLATLLELSVRKTPSLMFEIWQRSTLTVILNVVPPFWRMNFAALSTMQFEMFNVEAALICPNLSSPLHSGDARDVHGARGLDREGVFTDVGPAEVLQVAAVVEMHAVDTIVAEDCIAQRRAVLHAEGRILALFLAAVAEISARVVGLAAAVVGAAGHAHRRADRHAARRRAGRAGDAATATAAARRTRAGARRRAAASCELELLELELDEPVFEYEQ